MFQVALHYFPTPELYTSLRQVCLLPSAILAGNRPLERLLLSGFLHGDDNHLYYNMVGMWRSVHFQCILFRLMCRTGFAAVEGRAS